MEDDDTKKSEPDSTETDVGEDRPLARKRADLSEMVRHLTGSNVVAQFNQSQRLAEQLSGLTMAGDQFSAVTKLAKDMRALTGASDAVAKFSQIGWSKSVTEALTHNLRPWSVANEALRLDAAGSALSLIKRMDLDAGKFGMAAKIAKEISDAGAFGSSVAKLSVLGVESGIAAELRRLQQSMPVFRPDPHLERIAKDFAASIAPYQSQFLALSKAIEAATSTLRPHAEVFRRAAEEERVAEFILELGFVPHGELWECIAEIERPDGEDLSDFSERLVTEIWAELAKKLSLEVEDCMGDDKLYTTYGQMMAAHEAGLHEMAMNSVPTILERAVGVARRQGEKQRTFEWIETEVAQLPVSLVGGYRGYRVWKILIDHTFAGCWTDAEADASKYPNRHASAHGIGTRLASKIDSLNAILLTHFVITMAKAVRDYKSDEAA